MSLDVCSRCHKIRSIKAPFDPRYCLCSRSGKTNTISPNRFYPSTRGCDYLKSNRVMGKRFFKDISNINTKVALRVLIFLTFKDDLIKRKSQFNGIKRNIKHYNDKTGKRVHYIRLPREFRKELKRFCPVFYNQIINSRIKIKDDKDGLIMNFYMRFVFDYQYH